MERPYNLACPSDISNEYIQQPPTAPPSQERSVASDPVSFQSSTFRSTSPSNIIGFVPAGFPVESRESLSSSNIHFTAPQDLTFANGPSHRGAQVGDFLHMTSPALFQNNTSHYHQYCPPQSHMNTHESRNRNTLQGINHHHDAGHDPQVQINRPYHCKWEGCEYTHSFMREAELMRHVKNIHVSPGSFKCSVQGCTRVCNREDNLKAHTRRRHQNT